MAAARYAETAADSIAGGDEIAVGSEGAAEGMGATTAEEVEIYRRYLFDDEATYSKCEDDDDDVEDDGEAEGEEVDGGEDNDNNGEVQGGGGGTDIAATCSAYGELGHPPTEE